MVDIISNWGVTLNNGYERQYIPRVSEYARHAQEAHGSRSSQYATKLINDINWIKRYCFFPYYKFSSLTAPSIQKKDIAPLYPIVRHLLVELSKIAVNIEKTTKGQDPQARPSIPGINNPWDAYIFEIPSAISRHMDMLFPKEKRNNLSLIMFTASVTSVLDYLMNNQNSWAYSIETEEIFRDTDSVSSSDTIDTIDTIDTTDTTIGGDLSLYSDGKIDTEAIFKEALAKKRRSEGVPSA
jgi:hypothetical protein